MLVMDVGDENGTCSWKGQLEKREVRKCVMKLERMKLESSGLSWNVQLKLESD